MNFTPCATHAVSGRWFWGKFPGEDGGDAMDGGVGNLCVLILLNAEYVREVEPGEMLRISKSGLEVHPLQPAKAASILCFRTCILFAA